MKLSISKDELKEYVRLQLEHFFPDKIAFKGNDVDVAFDIALDRMEYCCKQIKFRHFCVNGEVDFRHTYSDQYCMFLYFLSNSLWKHSQNKNLSDRLVLLNRTLHGCLIPYTVKLPNIFLLVHSIGTILGNVDYSDYLVVLQNVTINAGEVKIGKGVFFSASSKVIGNCNIGDRTSIGVNTVIFNRNIPNNTVAFVDAVSGTYIERIKTNKCKAADYFFDIPFEFIFA